MSGALREKIARIVDPYIPQDLVCIGMEYELADEILAIPELAAAIAMEARQGGDGETRLHAKHDSND